MAFLTISGYEIPISATGASLERTGYGNRSVSYGRSAAARTMGCIERLPTIIASNNTRGSKGPFRD